MILGGLVTSTTLNLLDAGLAVRKVRRGGSRVTGPTVEDKCPQPIHFTE